MSELADKYIAQREYDYEEGLIEAARKRDEEANFLSPSEVEGKTVSTPKEDPLVKERSQHPLEKVVSGIGDWITRIPENASSAVIRAGDNMTRAILGPLHQEMIDATHKYIPGAKELDDAVGQWVLDREAEDPGTNQIMQWLIPWGAYQKGVTAAYGLKGVALSAADKISIGIGTDIAATYLNMDPHTERLADVAKQFGIENEIVSYLTSDEGSEDENRLRNVLDQVGMPLAVAKGFMGGMKGFRAAWQNKDKIKADLMIVQTLEGQK